ncbi:unnamed protein product, partial [Dovyalis caffra]
KKATRLKSLMSASRQEPNDLKHLMDQSNRRPMLKVQYCLCRSLSRVPSGDDSTLLDTYH